MGDVKYPPSVREFVGRRRAEGADPSLIAQEVRAIWSSRFPNFSTQSAAMLLAHPPPSSQRQYLNPRKREQEAQALRRARNPAVCQYITLETYPDTCGKPTRGHPYCPECEARRQAVAQNTPSSRYAVTSSGSFL